MTNIFNNQSAVQAGIAKLGGVAFLNYYTWSSSEYTTNHAWISYFGYSYGVGGYPKGSAGNYVRPVMEF